MRPGCIIGIDPGISGAIAVLRALGDGVQYTATSVLEVVDMPYSAKLAGKGNQVNAVALARYLQTWGQDADVRVLVEQVNAMPAIGKDGNRRSMGVTSAMNFGRSCGIVEGVVAALVYPLFYVSPQTWKKRAGLLGKDKDAARTLCIQRHPSIAGRLQRKKDCGRADAILIAEFGMPNPPVEDVFA